MVLTQVEIEQIDERGMGLWLDDFSVGQHNCHKCNHCMTKAQHPGPLAPILLALRTNLTREFPTSNVEVDESPIPSVNWERIGWFGGSVTKSQNNGDFKEAVLGAAEAHPGLNHLIPFQWTTCRWSKALLKEIQKQGSGCKGDRGSRQSHAMWTTSDLMDLDTPNPDCDNLTLRFILMPMRHTAIADRPVIRQAAPLITDRSKVVLTCLIEDCDLMREAMGALPLVMLGF